MDSVALPQDGRRRPAKIVALSLSLVLAGVSAARAQQTPSESNEPQSRGRFSVRLGEGSAAVPPITAKARFKMAAERSWVGVAMAATGVGVSQEPAPVGQAQIAAGLGIRFASAAADNTIGTFMTTAVASSLFRQDPRYFAAGRDKGFARRAAYAASRVLVTRGESGRPQFNVSRVAGNAGAVGISTLYSPTTDGSVSGMLTAVGTQLLWDAASNELKEFWPDIRRAIFRH